jgi:hypothetical protein
MKFHTLIRLNTAEYQFNNISELFGQLDHFGFPVEAAFGQAHEAGSILESSVEQQESNLFTIDLVWRDEVLFYQMLVSTLGKSTLAYIANLKWTLEFLKKVNIE